MGTFDAIAIGGGLAGAASALELARNGVRVALIERSATPALKVCGDFLSREARELLRVLGVDIVALGAREVHTFRLVNGRASADAALPFAAAGLSRLRLDEALIAQAKAAGAEVIRGEAVTALDLEAGLVRVRTPTRELSADTAVLATGKHNLRGWPRRACAMTAFKMPAELSSAATRALREVVQLATYRGGYVGACNVEEGATTICWLLDADAMSRAGSDWTAHLAFIARQCPVMGDLLSGARFLSARPAAVAAVPYGYKRHGVIAPNVFPVGDQLAVIPSFTGDGTSLALSSGLAAAQAVLAGQTADTYQAAFLRRIRGQFVWAKAVDATFKASLTRAMGVGAVAAMPWLARSVANLTRLQAEPATTRA